MKDNYPRKPDDSDMTDAQFVEAFAKLHADKFDFSDEGYLINPAQFQKLLEATEFFEDLAKNYGGSMEPVNLRPGYRNGTIHVKFELLSVHLKNLDDFRRILNWSSAFEILPISEELFELSIVIPNVFEKKDQQ